MQRLEEAMDRDRAFRGDGTDGDRVVNGLENEVAVGARVVRELDGVAYHGVVVGSGFEEQIPSRQGELLWDVR